MANHNHKYDQKRFQNTQTCKIRTKNRSSVLHTLQYMHSNELSFTMYRFLDGGFTSLSFVLPVCDRNNYMTTNDSTTYYDCVLIFNTVLEAK